VNRLDFYRQTYRSVYPWVMEMSRAGIRCDRTRLQAAFDKYTQTLADLRKKLAKQAGESLFGDKGSISHVKLKRFFFETLECTPIYKREKGQLKLKTDEFAVRTIRRRNLKRPEVVQACDDILAFRFADARKKFVNPKVVDKDSRIRATYSFNTLTLRFGSLKNPMGTGHNLQNPPRGERGHFLPDKGHIFLMRDLSQAESRIVYMLTGDKDLISRARSQPWEYDDHAEVAMAIRRILIKEGIVDARLDHEPTPEEFKILRFFGKMVNHASNYASTGKMVSEALLELGYVVAPSVCQTMIDAKMAIRPAILDVFQRGCRRLIASEKLLVNPLGHQLSFEYVRFTNDIWRKGYMFIPQSTVPMLMNRGIRKTWDWTKAEHIDAKIRNQVHDEAIWSVKPSHAWKLAQHLGRSLEQEVLYPDLTVHRRVRPMTIPSTLKVGSSWEHTTEFKTPPTRAAFMEAVEKACEELRR
jgi:hypothetical protein